MTPADQRDLDKLELIVELAEHIERRVGNLEWSTFLADKDEADLTAFRLLHIGESAHKLSAELKRRHPELPWVPIYRMRNILSHDYAGMETLLIWETAKLHLGPLIEMCRAEIERILK